jgi:translocation and assembly module TamA
LLVLLWLFCLVPLARAAESNGVAVAIVGVSGEVLEQVQSSLSIAKEQGQQQLTDDWLEVLHGRAPEEIRESLQALGYYRAQVRGELRKDGPLKLASYRIDLGPALRVTKLNISVTGEGAADPEFEQVLRKLPLKRGAPLHHGRYEASKSQLERLATARGYLDARWTRHEALVDLGTYQASVFLNLNTGRRYRFGNVEFPEGNIKRSVLAKSVPWKRGEPYSAAKLLDLQNKLRDTNYFTQVEVAPRREAHKDGEIPIAVRLTPNKKLRYSVGLGFGTDTGPRLALALDNRYTNRRGNRLSLDARISPVLSRGIFEYSIPYAGPRKARISVTGSLVQENTDTAKSRALQLGVSQISTVWGWQQTLSLRYLFEDFKIADEQRQVSLLIPGIGWWRSEADDTLYPRRGYRVSLDFSGAFEGFVSDTSFVQGRALGKLIRPVGKRDRLLLRAELGATSTPDFDLLPASLRFFAGGDNSIRGFGFKNLGPTNARGLVIGGRYLAVGSVEYEHRVRDKWAVAVFSDFGNAFNDFNDKLHYSIGTGIRWRSPVGPVRLDIATGISEDDTPVRLHLTLGPEL